MTQSAASAAKSWLATSDAVLRGLNHEFSNRISLARLAPQLAAMSALGEPEMGRIAADLDRSEDLLNLLRLYRLMVFSNSEPAEPILVSDVVPAAVDLFRHHADFRDIDVRVGADGTIPPVLMNPAALTKSVLLLLCVAARTLAVAPGDSGVVDLTFAANADAVRMSAEGVDARHDAAAGEPPELPALHWLIRDAEGAVEFMRAGATLSIGTLVSLRRREKRG